MKPIAPNTLIQNRYLIVHLIGKGGMGEVYLAVDQRLGSAIALKRTFFSDDATLGGAFEREAKTLARLRHPVLPKVSDHFTEEGTQYLVMEHISGEDISKRLEMMVKPFPLSWVLFWADQLLDSLTYLHSHEPPIIHRDIKPQNLKLTDENHIVLLDFGLSKNSVGETRATTGGSIVGYTPHYASMEQIRGTGTDARSDLYSLSATLYQILTVMVPPDALTRADSLINGLPDPIKPISELNTEVSKTVSDVIIKGMAISQEQRYKTAREMQKALRDAYAQMQAGVSANTGALVPQTPAEIPQSQQKTEQFSNISLGSQPSLATSSKPTGSVSLPSEGKSNTSSLETNQENPVQDFDATIRYEPDLDDADSKQSDIRTEVLLAGSSAAITSAQNGEFGRADSFPVSDNLNKAESFDKSENFAFDDNFDEPKSYSPDATVPLISFDSKADKGGQSHTATSFDPIPEQEGNQKTGRTFVPEAVSTLSAATPKKSSGKGLAIGGGIAALLILAIAAAGIGWFMLRGDNRTAEDLPATPTPEATITIEPTVAPTTEVVNETNSLTNTELSNSVTNSETNTNESTLPQNPTNQNRQTQQVQTTPIPVRTPTSRPTPQVTTVKTPLPVKTPAPAKTPKIVIIQ